MLITVNLLPLLVSLPFVGALFLSLVKCSRDFARWLALCVKALVFVISLDVCYEFNASLDSAWFQCLSEFTL
jgi:NADH:ubiquinone oxidoreductase subunit 4 (subunit M)